MAVEPSMRNTLHGLSMLRAAERGMDGSNSKKRSWTGEAKHDIATTVPQVLVLTDLGKDIDDSLALLLLARQAQLGRLRIAGLVAGGGASERRARACETLLHATLRTRPRAVLAAPVQDPVPCVAGSDIPISASMRNDEIWHAKVLTDVTGGSKTCNEGEQQVSDGSAGAQLIVDVCKAHGRNLKILCIGPATDLALAWRLDGEAVASVGGIHFQGQCLVDGGEVMPDEAAFNFRCDMDAATEVLQALRGSVPMWMVGKHAAYQINLEGKHFKRWDGSAGHWGTPNFVNAVMEGLVHLSAASPSTFERVFGADSAEKFRTARDGGATQDELADILPFLSCPYDALAALSLLPEAEQHFDVERLGGRDEDGAGAVLCVGNSPPNRGVKDPLRTRTYLLNSISAALSRSYVGSGPDDTSFEALTPPPLAAPPPARMLEAARLPPRDKTLRVVVGTTNKMKLRSVEEALVATGWRVEVQGAATASGVPGQPVGGAETFGGALNRARQARVMEPDADVWLGLENGLVSVDACLSGPSVLPPSDGGGGGAAGASQWVWFETVACAALSAWGGDTPSLGSSMGVQVPLYQPPSPSPDPRDRSDPRDWLADYVGYFFDVQVPTAGFDTAQHHSGGLLARPEALRAATACAVGRLLPRDLGGGAS